MKISELIDSLEDIRLQHDEMQVSILYGADEYLPVAVEFVEEGVVHGEMGGVSEPADLPDRIVIRVGHPAVP